MHLFSLALFVFFWSGWAPVLAQGYVSSDEIFARVDDEVGGFGGSYIEDRKLVLVLRDSSQAGSAVAALKKHFDPQIMLRVRGVRVRMEENLYGYRELLTWYRAASVLWGLDGIVASHIDESQNIMEFETTRLFYWAQGSEAHCRLGNPRRGPLRLN